MGSSFDQATRAKLIALLDGLGSDSPFERARAGADADRLLKQAGLGWDDVIAAASDKLSAAQIFRDLFGDPSARRKALRASTIRRRKRAAWSRRANGSRSRAALSRTGIKIGEMANCRRRACISRGTCCGRTPGGKYRRGEWTICSRLVASAASRRNDRLTGLGLALAGAFSARAASTAAPGAFRAVAGFLQARPARDPVSVRRASRPSQRAMRFGTARYAALVGGKLFVPPTADACRRQARRG